jgi:hypothetical protein
MCCLFHSRRSCSHLPKWWPLRPLLRRSGAPESLPLDLATALGLTQAQNPRIAFTQAQIAQAYAQNQAARVMWLPSLRAGMNYNKHEGRIQEVIGRNIETSRGAMYGGFGANAVGAGSPTIPGLYMQFHTTDAIFQRRITGFALNARQFQGTAVTNDQLLETALAYLALLDAMQRKAIAAETLQHGQALVELTANFARPERATWPMPTGPMRRRRCSEMKSCGPRRTWRWRRPAWRSSLAPIRRSPLPRRSRRSFRSTWFLRKCWRQT